VSANGLSCSLPLYDWGADTLFWIGDSADQFGAVFRDFNLSIGMENVEGAIGNRWTEAIGAYLAQERALGDELAVVPVEVGENF
jgi:hypothetical protein